MDTKILIIAADPDIREFQSSYFSKRKYEVATAQNPQEALEAATKSPPEIVIYDIPYKSFEARLDILDPLKSIKPDSIIYLITTFVDKELKDKALVLGAREVLFKPISSEELEEKIKEAIT